MSQNISNKFYFVKNEIFRQEDLNQLQGIYIVQMCLIVGLPCGQFQG